ncbi:MAG: site-2 protease family protein [Akkermansiaceae bacterium]|nr:site-2 protease family protein [Akkermansiaceae bacterium]
MIQFTLFGIPVRVELWFWVTTALIGGALNATNQEDMLRTAMFMLAAFVSVLVHEMGHALTIKKFKLPTNVVLTFMGGYATHPPGVLTRRRSFFVTLAGPAVQFTFGIAVLYLKNYLPVQGMQIDSFFAGLIWISLAWAIFNCLPIYPMDGGQMLAAVLGPRRATALHITGIVTSAAIAILALKFGLYFIAVFMCIFAYQNYQSYKQVSR